MKTMRVIAEAGGYKVVQNMSGLVEIQKGSATHFCDGNSAYELIRDEVKDPAVRTELLKQWSADLAAQGHAERNSKDGEFRA